jgi:hypothetical protein
LSKTPNTQTDLTWPVESKLPIAVANVTVCKKTCTVQTEPSSSKNSTTSTKINSKQNKSNRREHCLTDLARGLMTLLHSLINMISLVMRMTWITRSPGPNLHHQMHGKNHPQTNLIMASLIQWNCRGLRANFNDLLILQNENPVAFALQELAISDSYSFQNRQYSLFS